MVSKETCFFKNDIFDLLCQIEGESEAIGKAAEMVSSAIIADQLVHVIGTGGHSNLFAEETLWRAGGLAPMNAMLDCGTNLMMGAKRSNIVERTPGYGTRVFDMYGCKAGEVMIICNAYGINSMTIDVALEAKKRGLKTIGVTSRSFCDTVPASHPARHPSGKNLYEIVDVWINSHVPYGDANVKLEGFDQEVAGTSVICNSFAWNLILIETCRMLIQKGFTPPVWRSANAEGGDEANYALEQRYFSRVKHLR